MKELKGSEKQVKWANDLRKFYIRHQNLVKEMILDEIGITDDIKQELKLCGFETLDEAFDVIKNIESAKVIIEEFKGLNENSIENSRRYIEETFEECKHLTDKAALSHKDLWVCHIISTAEALLEEENELRKRGRL